jgi:hypothetical protein
MISQMKACFFVILAAIIPFYSAIAQEQSKPRLRFVIESRFVTVLSKYFVMGVAPEIGLSFNSQFIGIVYNYAHRYSSKTTESDMSIQSDVRLIGLGLTWQYEGISINKYLRIMPGANIGAWSHWGYIEKYQMNGFQEIISSEDLYANSFLGPKLKLEIGSKQFYITVQYNLYLALEIAKLINTIEIGGAIKFPKMP